MAQDLEKGTVVTSAVTIGSGALDCSGSAGQATFDRSVGHCVPGSKAWDSFGPAGQVAFDCSVGHCAPGLRSEAPALPNQPGV